MAYQTANKRDRFLNETQLAEYLNLPVRTLQAWRLRGGGPPFHKIGRAVRYRQSDIETWLAHNRATSTSDIGIARRFDGRSK